jgi:hypothetical protein
MKKVLFCFLLTVVFLWSICTKKPASAEKVEVIDHIEYVHNTDIPMHPDRTVAFEEELSIGPEDEKGNILL